MLELMTVMAIIIILVSIIMPTVGVFLDTSKLSKSRARVNGLDIAIRQYQRELQNDWPGQRCITDTGFPTNGLYTDCDQGSQWLALNLFYWGEPNASHIHPEYYVKMTRDMLDCPCPTWSTNNGVLITNKPDTILDLFPKPKPILYYVSWPAKKGLDQFQFSQNSAYMTGAPTEVDANFKGVITNTGISTGMTMPYRAGEYLIIGSGISRTYFTGEDITNFNKQ